MLNHSWGNYTIAAVLILSASCASAAPQLGVQIGAFSSVEQANAQSSRAKGTTAQPVEIRKELTQKGVLYKVVVGSFATRAEAEGERDRLAEQNLPGFIRENSDFSLETTTRAIEGPAAPYFTTGTLVAEGL